MKATQVILLLLLSAFSTASVIEKHFHYHFGRPRHNGINCERRCSNKQGQEKEECLRNCRILKDGVRCKNACAKSKATTKAKKSCEDKCVRHSLVRICVSAVCHGKKANNMKNARKNAKGTPATLKNPKAAAKKNAPALTTMKEPFVCVAANSRKKKQRARDAVANRRTPKRQRSVANGTASTATTRNSASSPAKEKKARNCGPVKKAAKKGFSTAPMTNAKTSAMRFPAERKRTVIVVATSSK